jgi:hypothetical protein
VGQGLSVLRGVVGGCEHSASVEEERAVDADACLRLCSMLEDSDDVLFQVCRLCRRCGCSPLPPRARASVPCLVLIERLQALSCGFAPSLTITASPHHRITAPPHQPAGSATAARRLRPLVMTCGQRLRSTHDSPDSLSSAARPRACRLATPARVCPSWRRVLLGARRRCC